jgi:hypothetical protein
VSGALLVTVPMREDVRGQSLLEQSEVPIPEQVSGGALQAHSDWRMRTETLLPQPIRLAERVDVSSFAAEDAYVAQQPLSAKR